MEYSPRRHVFKKKKNVKLACVMRLASVHSKPRSHSMHKVQTNKLKLSIILQVAVVNDFVGIKSVYNSFLILQRIREFYF